VQLFALSLYDRQVKVTITTRVRRHLSNCNWRRDMDH
jgi:hypothetical protein